MRERRGAASPPRSIPRPRIRRSIAVAVAAGETIFLEPEMERSVIGAISAFLTGLRYVSWPLGPFVAPVFRRAVITALGRLAHCPGHARRAFGRATMHRDRGDLAFNRSVRFENPFVRIPMACPPVDVEVKVVPPNLPMFELAFLRYNLRP